MMKVRDTVSYETVYVFYPDWGFTDDEAELKKVSGLLEKFHIDHEESMLVATFLESCSPFQS